MPLNLNISSKKNFLRKGRVISVDATLAPNAGDVFDIPQFLQTFFKHNDEVSTLSKLNRIAVDSNKTGRFIANLRGRPAETFYTKAHTQDGLAPGAIKGRISGSEEEIFFVSGGIASLPDRIPSDQKNIRPADHEFSPFVFQVTSRFFGFDEEKRILYQLQNHSSGPLRELLPSIEISEIPWVIPARIHLARYGTEVFRNRFFGSIFGFAPNIEARFYLELDLSKMKLAASAEINPQPGANIGEEFFSSVPSLEAFARALDALALAIKDENLAVNFREQLIRKLG